MKCSYKRPNRSVSERIFTYNVDNRLTEVAQRAISGGRVTENVINRNVFRGDGQRIQRDMLKYVYRDGTALYTTGGGSSWIANFYYRAPNSDIMAIRHDTNFTTVSSTITTDIRGSTLSIFDDSRGLRGGFRYSDFGITQRVGWCDQNIDVAYTGGIWDEVTGLYYLNARFYNPVDARFLQIDVARNGGDLRATLSLYGYTEGDPINKVDPTGYASRWVRIRYYKVTAADERLHRIPRRIANGIAIAVAVSPAGRTKPGATIAIFAAGFAGGHALRAIREGDFITTEVLHPGRIIRNRQGQTFYEVQRRTVLRRARVSGSVVTTYNRSTQRIQVSARFNPNQQSRTPDRILAPRGVRLR